MQLIVLVISEMQQYVASNLPFYTATIHTTSQSMKSFYNEINVIVKKVNH